VSENAEDNCNPFSRHAKQYNRDVLQDVLQKNGIVYLFFGKEFGARRLEENLQTNGQVNFEKVARDEIFHSGILRVKKGIARGYTIAMMCTEKDPVICHRAILVARSLSEMGMDIGHILADGSFKMHEQLEQELIGKYYSKISQLELQGWDQSCSLLEKAYREANFEIGYRAI
jgi:uncharacterized protein (DUF488 family)